MVGFVFTFLLSGVLGGKFEPNLISVSISISHTHEHKHSLFHHHFHLRPPDSLSSTANPDPNPNSNCNSKLLASTSQCSLPNLFSPSLSSFPCQSSSSSAPVSSLLTLLSRRFLSLTNSTISRFSIAPPLPPLFLAPICPLLTLN